MKSKEIVALKQEPIIIYNLVEAKGKEVQERISSLDIDNLPATEENLKVLRSTRAELNKEFKIFEEQRKLVKDMIMKPYSDFEYAYKEHIQKHFKNADAILKSKVYEVDDMILQNKIEGIKSYFKEINTFDFIKFEDVRLDIKKSVSDKKLKEQIEEYLLQVQSDLNTIETLPSKDRVLAKYQIVKDLNKAISDVNIEIQREEQIQKQREQQQEQQAHTEQQEEDKIYQTSFRVRATKTQIQALKEFMHTQRIAYEPIK